MKVLSLIGISLCHIVNINAVSISSLSEYPEFCQKAAEDSTVFANFRHDPIYRDILEHVSYEQGKGYFKIIRRDYPFLLKYVENCRENDRIGNPIRYNYPRPFKGFSPTTLRYMKVAGDLIDLFGDLSKMKIGEIGAGYGGQCHILSAITGFESYTIFDLPQVCLLAKRYVSSLDVPNVNFFTNNQIPSDASFDLVISNYALSEISQDEQLGYIAKVLNKSKMGYVTYNSISADFGIKSYTIQEILSLMQVPGREFKILPESPVTGPNVILVWYPKKS